MKKLIPKHQKAGKISRVNFLQLQKDPEYKNMGNIRMILPAMEQLLDSLIGRNLGYPLRIAAITLILSESGGDTSKHPNGSSGIASWRGARALNMPRTLSGLIHKFMVELHNPDDPNAWTHGGKGTGVKTGKEMQGLFMNTVNTRQANNALMKGLIRPETSLWSFRDRLLQLVKKYAK